VADITGQLTGGRFEFTFHFLGLGISWVGHGVAFRITNSA
jgi:hypothetical protein